jgi:hypothetical protein
MVLTKSLPLSILVLLKVIKLLAEDFLEPGEIPITILPIQLTNKVTDLTALDLLSAEATVSVSLQVLDGLLAED